MIEVRLALSVGAVEAIAQGDEIVFDIEEDGIRVFIRCDDIAVGTFRKQIERALLHMLPASSTPH